MKRRYVKPAVESEEAVEQTSLQCNMSIFPMETDCDWAPSAWAGSPGCTEVVSKGGVFAVPGVGACDVDINIDWDCVVALS